MLVIYGKALKVTKAHRTLAALFTVGVLFVLCVSPALAHRGRVFGPSFGGPGAGAGQLSLVQFTSKSGSLVFVEGGSGLAADEVTHNVFVADTGNDRVDEFTSAGVFVRAWGWGVVNGAAEFQVCTEATGCRAGLSGTSPGQFESPAFVAVDDSPSGEGDVYVADYHQGSGDRLVQKFTAQGALVESWGNKGQIDEESPPAPERLGSISGVAVAPTGRLLVGTGDGVFEFGQSTGSYIETLPPSGRINLPNGFAVDGLGNFYFEYNATEIILKFNASGAGEGGVFETVTPKPPGYAFWASGLAVAKSGELYVDEGNAIQVVASSCVSLCAPSTTFSSPLLTGGAGLAVDSQRETVYIAEAAAGKIESIIPEPPASPLVEAGSQTVSDVSGDSATLEAAVSPRSETSEEPTSYRFEYTTDERFQREGFTGASSIPVPDGQLSPNFEADLLSAHVQGLQAGTVYHYRVVAENAISRKEGRPTEGERNEAGEEIVRTFTTQIPGVFSLPDGRAWELVSPPDKRGALIKPIGPEVTQASVSGDAFTYLATASTESAPAGNSNGTQVLSTRAAVGASSSWGSRDISTPREVANGLNLGDSPDEYRFFSSDLSLSVVNPFGAFVPSMSAEASEQTAFLRTDFPNGDPAAPCVSSCYHPLVTGAPGFANVPEGTGFGGGQCHTGETRECGPKFLDATPDASHILLASSVALTEGAPSKGLYEWTGGQLQLVSVLPNNEPSPGGGTLGFGYFGGEGVGRNVISVDGSRVVWSTSKSLYLRDMVREETVQLGAANAEFQTASSDDTRVFFTVAGDLYEFEAPTGAVLSTGHLTNLTPAGGVLGFIPGASQDGSAVYFVSENAMTGSEANEHGETALAGHPDLYVAKGGTIRLVAVLSSGDGRDWMDTPPLVLFGRLTSRVSPDGRWLAFMSERSLTGYDNRDASSGQRDEEVFLYDATANGGQGGLVCASCDPTGARPHGVFDTGTVLKTLLVDDQFSWIGRWLAGSVPGWTSSIYQSRYLSDAGRLFFNSPDALVPSDTNGTEDVYEYEPPGIGGCTSASVTFSVRSGGCVGLVSSGTSKEESAFLDASESGDDVFLLTSAQLSKQDTDTAPDVYDARVGGGFPEPQAPPACEGDACQSPVAAPNDQTPGSLTYQGPGNPQPLLSAKKTKKKTVKCRRGRRLAHGRCVKGKKTQKMGRARKPGIKRGARS